jgi:hypothetical protein
MRDAGVLQQEPLRTPQEHVALASDVRYLLIAIGNRFATHPGSLRARPCHLGVDSDEGLRECLEELAAMAATPTHRIDDFLHADAASPGIHPTPERATYLPTR